MKRLITIFIFLNFTKILFAQSLEAKRVVYDPTGWGSSIQCVLDKKDTIGFFMLVNNKNEYEGIYQIIMGTSPSAVHKMLYHIISWADTCQENATKKLPAWPYQENTSKIILTRTRNEQIIITQPHRNGEGRISILALKEWIKEFPSPEDTE